MANSDNPKKGDDFEILARDYFSDILNMELQRKFIIEIGISNAKKPHTFDLGSHQQKIIVECKRHTWTSGNYSPSAKFSVWNEAMYYFSLVNLNYKKILFVLKSINPQSKSSLADTYITRNIHLIPPNTEIWEFDNRLHILKYPIK